jgi:lipopolysaccharide heptosyltransferase II
MIEAAWISAKRILVVRLENLGDILVTTPAIHAIRASLPQSRITVLASPRGKPAVLLNPEVDDVIVHQAPWIDDLSEGSQGEQQLIALLKERRFDGAFIFTSFRHTARSQAAAYLCYLADIPLRVAASSENGILLTTHYRPPVNIIHEVEHALNLVKTVGITTQEQNLVLAIPEKAKKNVKTLLSSYHSNSSKPLIVVHPGCSNAGRMARTYPWKMYVKVIEKLVEQLDATIMITGTGEEQILVNCILSNVQKKMHQAVFSLANRLSFSEFCALIEAADVTITNNTGPMHISAAVQTPLVVLYALTHLPQQWRPWNVQHKLLYHDVSCRACYTSKCPHQQECLQKVAPEEVVEAVVELLFHSRALATK